MACPTKLNLKLIESPNSTRMMKNDEFDPLVSFLPNPQMDIGQFIHDPSQQEWSQPFVFVLMADPQFGLIEKYYLKKENPRWDEEIRITTSAILQVNQMNPRPKFVIICGDMLDTRPGTDEEIQLRNEQYHDFMTTLKLFHSDIKIIFCAGNHDVCDIPTPESIEIYRQQFGPDFFSFWVSGVKFTVLNSSYWKSPTTIPAHYEKQELFLKQISDSKAKHLVVFQHIPFFVSDPEEEDVSYLNIEKERRLPILSLLEAAAGGFYKNIEQVVTSALCNPLGSDPPGFLTVNVTEERITSQFVKIEFGESVSLAE